MSSACQSTGTAWSLVWNTAAKLQLNDWNLSFFNKKKPKQTTFLHMRGMCMPGEPLFTSPMLNSAVELLIFMLLLLQLATCRNDTSPKHSCQKFWALYFTPWCSPRCISVIQFYMQTRLFGDDLALRWGVGVEGFLLLAEALFPGGSLAAAPREYTPCWQFTSRGLHSSWLANNKQKTK